jgi:tRNA dimethylallyltransferase
MFPEVPPKPYLRKRLNKKNKKELFRIYKKLDPKGAKFIDKENKVRLVRAIEVCKTTKKPFWTQRKEGKQLFQILKIGIKVRKKDLKKRIEKRTKKMLKAGLDKEIKKLVRKYGSKILLKIVGYKEWFGSVEQKLKETKKLSFSKKERYEIQKEIITHTIQTAKRQMTWFNTDKRINWIKNYSEAKKLIKDFIKSN